MTLDGVKLGDSTNLDLKDPNKPKKQSFIDKAKTNFKKTYNNEYLNRLFPEIKQQKPGYDYYSFIFAVQLILCFYVILFYSNMDGTK